MEYSKAKQLAEIIVKIRLRNATFQERAVLVDWLGESEKNRQLYKRITRGESISRRLREEEQINESVDFVLVRDNIARRLVRKRRLRRFLELGSGSVAAACLAGAVLFMLNNKPDEGTRVTPVEENVIVAAKPEMNTRAMLILADGAQIDLMSDVPGVVEQEMAVIRGESGRLLYEAKRDAFSTDEEVEEIFNRVVTYVGGDYFLMLSDSTRVWLNAASELMYPDHFSADQRKVVLKGEAYFEVTKDVKRPFSVVLGDMEVKVLGTSFNVSAYPGVKRQTTLIEGQVAVNWHRQQVVIRPGQQAVETDEGLRVASVNVMNYVGWKEHRFVYENKLLGEVLEDLERWYDVEVFVMHDEIRNLHLTANLPKYENMDKVLEIIEYAACVKFEVKGRTVVVRRD